ncbi:CPBP family glutamic-type intramembrane protease [Mangrovivirga sp. M17]|uniref:CPBP family glutamic-type intramembrane protease n=1 Tax=Mangrovivirga halotolerans TaxID=2993936 RepID=A0ABT3RPQ5_9BACT|nr:CPBP family glutamic-type intramembrane protease [Mangrovivirga halotolerans]MCX2743323.1 CPBP family glutamic-type intramembrane protease [Mangrovivirga halotolerans]
MKGFITMSRNNFVELFHFLMYPDHKIQSDLIAKSKIKCILNLFLIKILLFGAIISLIKSFIIDIDLYRTAVLKSAFSYQQRILLMGMLLPIIEELGFRLYLIFKPVYLAISGGFLFYYLSSSYIFSVGYLDVSNDTFILRIGLSCLVLGIIYLLGTIFNNQLSSFWKVNFRWIFYFSILLFGLLHIVNFNIPPLYYLLAPIFTFSQLIAGFLYGFVRVKYGFLYALFFHMINNLFGVLISGG